MNWLISSLGIEIYLHTLQLPLLAINWPFTERKLTTMLVALAVGLVYLLFLLAIRLPSFIKYVVKSYREISRTIKD